MDNILIYIAVFIGLVALALVAQTVILFLAYRQIMAVLEQTHALTKEMVEHAHPILKNVEALSITIKDTGTEVLNQISSVSRSFRSRVESVASFTDRIFNRFNRQIDHADRLLGSALDNVGKAGEVVKESIGRPKKEASALWVGVKTALHTFGTTLAEDRNKQNGRSIDL